ncbi:MAG: transcription-repair coupling factor [Ignavibacteriales bacterium CG12_big_fil_rev_8_21_14_0_65_30_8]|nr:MAG: transcription-repair coupling factor [Ignavibacteriales bacterium CG12_big_fil_rev_8_21_14_0_65_30_8]
MPAFNLESNFINTHFIKLINKKLDDGLTTNPLFISPLYGSSKAMLVSQISKKINQLVILLTDNNLINELNVELNILGVSKKIILIDDFNSEAIQEKLTQIINSESHIIISTYDLLRLELPLQETIERSTTKIQIGGELTFEEIIEYLNLLIYQKEKFVEVQGSYSQRGSIIDFWSYSEHNPVRLEFDGDFLESIRYFDPDSQRSIDKVNEVTLAGSFNETPGFSKNNFTNIFGYLKDSFLIASQYNLNNTSNEKINLFEKTDEEKEQKTNEEKFKIENYKNVKWLIEQELRSSENLIDLGISEPFTINGNYKILSKSLIDYATASYTILITSENELQTQRLKELLSELDQKISALIEEGKIKFISLAIKEGFLIKEEKFLLLSDYQIFNKPYRTKLPGSKKYKRSKTNKISAITKGDYIVHEDYGIGQYLGLETINIGEVKQESMKLLYKDDSYVYVNLNYLTLVKKYSSSKSDGELKPTLSTLGTGEWLNTKKKTKKKIKEAARELIELYAKRKATKGYSFSSDTIWQKELEASFIYEDTPDQTKVTTEVKEDMQAENPMDRLVCGDVGFGKTEVAVRASFKAVQDGKQTAILVPTTILAEQHYNTFHDRLNQFPVRVEVLSRFQSKKKQTEIIKDLDEGKVDIVIGTHRLISKDIKFKNLGLLIIDEEHRFGVKAKEKLRSLKVNVDTLTMTATPIPRTLNLSLLGARDLSIIATPPPNRQPIHTKVFTFDILKMKEWIFEELKRNGQIYLVHDRVNSIDKLADYFRKYMPEVKIAIAHGQMKPKQLEDVIHEFMSKKYDVLISTKIIESGIDIPNVNTIIVNRADRFGLAELHQLRGRVGRSARQAFAYFIVPSLSGITKKALRRLQAIEEYTDVGAGFNLSMRDMEIRGTGNLLGTEQTGFINEVGFDLYIKLINEAVEELKYQEFKEIFKELPQTEEKTDPKIDTYFEIGIPKTYMPEQKDRLNYYTEFYSVNSIEEIEELKEEIKDRFGPEPILVKRLVAISYLKYYASYALFERINMKRDKILIILPKGDREDYYKFKFVELVRFASENYKKLVTFKQDKDIMKLIITNKHESPETLLAFLIKFCNEVIALFNVKEDIEKPIS